LWYVYKWLSYGMTGMYKNKQYFRNARTRSLSDKTLALFSRNTNIDKYFKQNISNGTMHSSWVYVLQCDHIVIMNKFIVKMVDSTIRIKGNENIIRHYLMEIYHLASGHAPRCDSANLISDHICQCWYSD
jgi:hypothetical protein